METGVEAVFKEHHNWMTNGLLSRLHDLSTADHTMALMAERLAKLQCDRDAVLHDPTSSIQLSSVKELISKTVDTYIKRQDPLYIRQQRLLAITKSIESCQLGMNLKRATYQQMHACIESECRHVIGSFDSDCDAALRYSCQLFLAYHE